MPAIKEIFFHRVRIACLPESVKPSSVLCDDRPQTTRWQALVSSWDPMAISDWVARAFTEFEASPVSTLSRQIK
jgi:hypothetical protein